MFGPQANVVVARARRSLLGMAGVAVGALLLSSVTLSLMLRPANAVSFATADESLPIVSVALIADDAFVAQTESPTDVIDHGHEPVELAAITVHDAGQRVRLVPRTGTVDVLSVGFPAGLENVAVSENGAQTATSTAGFDVAAERVFGSVDLRDYIRSDDPNRDGSDWGYDLDFGFDRPLTGDQYLVVRERNGNSTLRLTALDESGLPFATGHPLVIEPTYRWNTGYAPGDTNPAQPFHLAVFDIDTVLAATAADGSVPATEIHGLRIETDDGADLNLNVFVDESSEAALPIASIEEARSALAVSGSPSIAVLGHVYAGHDGGVACRSAQSFVEAHQGDPLTYCVTVTNTGTVTVSDLEIAAPALSVPFTAQSAGSETLAPGDSALYLAAATPPADDADGELDETYVATVTVTAVAEKAATEVVAEAEIVAFPPGDEQPIAPGVELGVSAHSDGSGASACVSTAEPVEADKPLPADSSGDDITYCFTVTNTGNTHLDSLAVSDPAHPGEPTLVDVDSEPLAPGGSAVFALEAPAADTETVTADPATPSLVTANAVDSSGSDLVGVDDVSAATAYSGQPAQPAAPPTVTPDPANDAQPASSGTSSSAPSSSAPSSSAPSSAPSSSAPSSSSPSPAGATTGQAGSAVVGGAGAGGSGSADMEPPTELAFTGWETTVFGIGGMVFLAVGLALLYPEHAGRARAFAFGQVGEPVRDYFEL